MKKRVIGMMVVGCMAVATVVSFVQRSEIVELTPLMGENAEALSDGEINPDCPNGCLTDPGSCRCYGIHPYKEAVWEN